MNYLEVLSQAIIFIESNIEEDISVIDVASEVGYSYYHLSRIFTAFLGETIGSYLKNRRLTLASQKLLYSDKRILNIGLESGFNSSEAFCRAFKYRYHVSPVQYRKNRMEYFIDTKKKLDSDILKHIKEHINNSPVIVSIDDIKVVGLRGETTLVNNTLTKLWGEFETILEKFPHNKKARRFGICDMEKTVYDVTGNVKFSQIVGIEVTEFKDDYPDFISCKVIKNGEYAVFTHKGSLEYIARSYDYIWGTWAMNTKRIIDESREDFELYDERFLGYGDENSEMDIYIPIK